MDNHGLNPKLLDRLKSLEYDVLEREENDNDAFSQQLVDIYHSFEYEVSISQKMDKDTLNQQLFDQIQSLENEGMTDRHFRICYSLKEDNGPSFFKELIPSFLCDVRTIIRDMDEALEPSVTNFDVLKQHCIKLKGSSGCIGACKLKKLCCDFGQAVDKKSKDECLLALENIKREYSNLQSKLESITQLEKEILSAESSQS